MFCPECGSTDKKMVGDVCIDCFLKDFQMIELPKRIEVQICSHCNSKLEEGKWSEEFIPEEEIIYRALERNIKIADEVSNEIVNLEIDQMKGTIAECYVEIIGEVEGTEIEATSDKIDDILKVGDKHIQRSEKTTSDVDQKGFARMKKELESMGLVVAYKVFELPSFDVVIAIWEDKNEIPPLYVEVTVSERED